MRLRWFGLLALIFTAAVAAAEVVRYRDFGAVGDGKTDDFAALVRAHAHANEKGLPVVAMDGATYYIGGADRTIEIQTSTDFGRAKFLIDDTKLEDRRSHVFELKSAHPPIKLKNAKPLKRAQDRIEANLPGPAVVQVTDTNVKRFIRRGGNRNSGSHQNDVFLVDRDGRVDPSTPIIWDFEQVTEMVILPLDEETLTIRGGHFTTIANQAESKYNYHARGIAIRRSNVVIEGLEHHIIGEGKTGAPYGGFLNIANCAKVLVKDTLLTGHKTYKTIGRAGTEVSMGSYDIHLNRALNVTLKNVTQTNDILDRKYWGIIGTNFCKNLVYDGCRLSRFDAHQGVTNATIRNSTLGYMSVRLTGFGQFLIEDSTVHGREFIGLRSDYGSTWNGDITIRNCRFVPPPGTREPVILGGSNDGRHDFGYTCHLPRRLIIDNLHIEDGKPPKGYQGPVIFGNINSGLKPGVKLPHPQVLPKELAYRGISTASGKKIRVSINPHLVSGVKIHAPEDK